MSDKDKEGILELLAKMLDSIEIVQHRTEHIKRSDDFLISSDNMVVLDSVCMKLMAIGESVKSIDKRSKGALLVNYPSVSWKEVMRMRDIIAHHYFEIDTDVVFCTLRDDLPVLKQALIDIYSDLKSDK